MSSATDEDLMQRVLGGDTIALDALFRRHHQRVHALCVRIVADASSADDLVQETFLRVMRFAGSYRGTARFTTWLYRIARNVCVDHLKHEQRRVQVQAFDDSELVSEPERDGRIHRLEHALARLPVNLREALVLNRFHDLPHQEVAAVLGCSVGAARVRVHRALRELARLVEELEAHDDIVRPRT